MNVTWDEKVGYHRLTAGDFSVLVTELEELEVKAIRFVCKSLDLIYHNDIQRLLPEIRKKAMDIYISDLLHHHFDNRSHGHHESMRLNMNMKSDLLNALKIPPPMEKSKQETPVTSWRPSQNKSRRFLIYSPSFSESLKAAPPLPKSFSCLELNTQVGIFQILS